MTESATQNEADIAQALVALERKKDAVKKIVYVTQAIERMQNSIQAVLLLNRPISTIPKRLLDFVTRLGDTTRIMPSKKIQETIGQLDAGIGESLAVVVQLARSGHYETGAQGPSMVTDTLATVSELLNVFRRKAQTSIALRLLLKERGLPSKPLYLPIDRDDLERQLSHIEQKEKTYRSRVEQGLMHLQQDARLVADNENLPDEFRAAAANMVRMLQRDIDHMRAGKNIDEMPIILEVVEMQDDRDPSWSEKPDPAPHVKSKSVAPIPVEKEPVKKSGLFKKLYRWVTSPLHVTWRDIDDRRS